MFSGCESLLEIPDISNWTTDNIDDMTFIFKDCKKIEKLPDIPKWNTINVIRMRGLFSGCESLLEVPDLSKWDNFEDYETFKNCKKLKTIPTFNKKETDLKEVTSACEPSSEKPDSLKLIESNVEE